MKDERFIFRVSLNEYKYFYPFTYLSFNIQNAHRFFAVFLSCRVKFFKSFYVPLHDLKGTSLYTVTRLGYVDRLIIRSLSPFGFRKIYWGYLQSFKNNLKRTLQVQCMCT